MNKLSSVIGMVNLSSVNTLRVKPEVKSPNWTEEPSASTEYTSNSALLIFTAVRNRSFAFFEMTNHNTRICYAILAFVL